MTIRLLTALPPLPAGMVASFPPAVETALVAAGLASTTLSGTPLFPTLDGSVTQYPLTVRRITAAERLAPTAGMLADTRVVYDDGLQWLKVNAAGTDLEPAASPAAGVARFDPLRNGITTAGVQFRGATDASNTLGTLGLVVNPASAGEAGTLLAASTPTLSSIINGASTTTAWRELVSTDPITQVYIGQQGLAGPYAVQTSGPCTAASDEMALLEFDSDDDVRRILWFEGKRTNYAGTPGTGSARQVIVVGVAA
jgi:hypothetical protein